jgi:hypothetical protein
MLMYIENLFTQIYKEDILNIIHNKNNNKNQFLFLDIKEVIILY